LEIHGGFDAKPIEMRVEPSLCLFAADVVPRPPSFEKCTGACWRAEMPRGYYADAPRLSRLWRHRNLHCGLDTIRSAPMSQIFSNN
jgi:hypothetical protein